MGKLYPGPTRGTWTPALTFVTPGDLATAYSTQLADWYLENGVLRAFFYVVASTFTHATASGALRISGLPFTAKTSTGMIWAGSISRFQGISKTNYTHLGCNVISAAVDIQIIANAIGQNISAVSAADMPTGSAKTFVGSVTYPVA